MIMDDNRVTEQSRFQEASVSCYPWLVFPHWEDGSSQTFCTISHPFKSYVTSTSKFWTEAVLGHCFGWFIISRKTIKTPKIFREFLYLWNPVSSESIKLPRLDLKLDQEIVLAFLLSPPSNPNSVVLVFSDIVKSFVFCKVGDKRWTMIPAKETNMKMEIIDDEPSYLNRYIECCPVNYKGRCYVAMSNELKVIEQVIPDNHLILRSLNCSLPPCNLSTANYWKIWLVESCGELCVINVTYAGLNSKQVLDIEIFSLDPITMKWSQVKCSKDRAFFFNSREEYAISCPTSESGIEGGFVYYTTGSDRILYCFNVEDKSISICQPCKSFPPWSVPFWFMPDLSTVSQTITREVKQVDEEKQITSKGIPKFSPIKFKTEAEVRNLCHLPLDVITVIRKNLYFLDYMNFRLACKTFRQVSPHIRWRETSFKLKSHSLPPWLMFADKGNDSTVHTLIDPKLGGDRYNFMNIPKSLIGYDIRCSKEGWLLMSSKVKGDSMFFYNPFTKNFIPVPPAPPELIIQSFGFSSSPTSPGCIVVGITWVSFCWLNLSRDEEWHVLWLYEDGHDPYFKPIHTSPVYLDGIFYFLGRQGDLVPFWIEESNDELMVFYHVLKTPTKPCFSFDQSYLLECGGYLYAIFVDNLGESIGVYWMSDADFIFKETLAWREVRDIGNYMFFVSSSSSFSMVAKTPGMENKIYFPKIKGREIVYYCLRTSKYGTFGREQVAANLYNTREYLNSSWIQQSWL